MEIEIKIPTVGESINEVTMGKWRKKDGDVVNQDEVLCEVESEKATFELTAEKAGKIKILAQEGAVLKIGDVVCKIDTSVQPTAQPAEAKTEKQAAATPAPKKEAVATPAPVAAPVAANDTYAKNIPSPAADKMMRESGAAVLNGTGKAGRITKEDVLNSIKNRTSVSPSASAPEKKAFSREERREKMSSLRRTVSKHLVTAKNQTAMLTTFNEVDMKPIMDIRQQYKDKFKDKYGVGLGFMSFFTKAVCNALQEFPAVNASLDGDEIIYHDFIDVSIAVSTPKGLVVPVIRNAESLSMAEIEGKVGDLAKRGRDNKLTLEEMTGGTFTITNGGVFGSLMSTPIINIPQVAILGMHKIQERPVVVNGQIVVRPMMYLALSYDHRIIDGKESVTFLVKVKEQLENPDQLLVGQDPVKLLLEL